MKLEKRVDNLLFKARENGLPRPTHILVGLKERAEIAEIPHSNALSLLCGFHLEPGKYQGMTVVPIYEYTRLMVGTLAIEG